MPTKEGEVLTVWGRELAREPMVELWADSERAARGLRKERVVWGSLFMPPRAFPAAAARGVRCVSRLYMLAGSRCAAASHSWSSLIILRYSRKHLRSRVQQANPYKADAIHAPQRSTPLASLER